MTIQWPCLTSVVDVFLHSNPRDSPTLLYAMKEQLVEHQSKHFPVGYTNKSSDGHLGWTIADYFRNVVFHPRPFLNIKIANMASETRQKQECLVAKKDLESFKKLWFWGPN